MEMEMERDSRRIHDHRHAQLTMRRRRAIKPDRLGVINRDSEKRIIIPAETRPDLGSRGGAAEGLAGVVKGRAGDGVGGVDFELDLVAGFRGQGGGGEG